MEPKSSSPYSQVPTICPYPERPFSCCVIPPLETPPRDLSGGVVYLRIVLSPEEAFRPTLVGCPRLLIQYIHSYPPYRRPFLHPQPEDAPCHGDRVSAANTTSFISRLSSVSITCPSPVDINSTIHISCHSATQTYK